MALDRFSKIVIRNKYSNIAGYLGESDIAFKKAAFKKEGFLRLDSPWSAALVLEVAFSIKL